MYFRRAAAAMRSLKLGACLSSMQARRIENTLSMKAEDGWIKAMFSGRARSQSSAVYRGSYTAVPSVLCLLVLSFFFSFLLYFVFCLIWRAESEDVYRLYVAVLDWSILLYFNRKPCLSSMQVRRIENTLSMKAEDAWIKTMFSSRARSQSSAVYRVSYTAAPSVLCLLALSSFFSFLLSFVFCLIWRAESEDVCSLYVAVLHWSILLCFNRKNIEMWNVLVCSA